MIQGRAVESMASAHRQDLLETAGGRRVSRRRAASTTSEPRATQHSAAGMPAAGMPAAGMPAAGGRAVHRVKAPRLGAWLIDFGTRLGGTSIRTS
jgi:hypothetical protein